MHWHTRPSAPPRMILLHSEIRKSLFLMWLSPSPHWGTTPVSFLCCLTCITLGRAVLHLFINTLILTLSLFLCLWSGCALHMLQSPLSHSLRFNLNVPSYKKAPSLPARCEYSGLSAVLAFLVLPFGASPPLPSTAVTCTHALSLTSLFTPWGHVLYVCLYLIPPNTIPCAMCTVNMSMGLNYWVTDVSWLKPKLYTLKSFTDVSVRSYCVFRILIRIMSGSPCKQTYIRSALLFVLLNCSLRNTILF